MPRSLTQRSAASTSSDVASALRVEGFALIRGALPPVLARRLRRTALDFASRHGGVDLQRTGFGPGGLAFPDLLAPAHAEELRPFLDAPLASPAVAAALSAAFNGSGAYGFNGMCDLQLNKTIGWHRDLVHPPYIHHERHDVWTGELKPSSANDELPPPRKAGATRVRGEYRIYRLILYLESHEHDDKAMAVVPRSHLSRGCTRPCGEGGRGYREAKLKKHEAPLVLRPALGDAVLFDQRLIHRGQARQDEGQPARITIQVSIGLSGSVYTHEFAEGARQRQRDTLLHAAGAGGQGSGFGGRGATPPGRVDSQPAGIGTARVEAGPRLRATCDAAANAAYYGRGSDQVRDHRGIEIRDLGIQPRPYTCHPSATQMGRPFYALPSRIRDGALEAAGVRTSLPPAMLSQRHAACAVVGPSGLLAGSGCGARIDGAGLVFRSFSGDAGMPVGGRWARDVGSRVDVTLTTGKMRKPLKRSQRQRRGAGGGGPLGAGAGSRLAAWVHSNRIRSNLTVLLTDACGRTVGDEWPAIARELGTLAPNVAIVPLRNNHLNCIDAFWRRAVLPESPVRWSSGIALVSTALELCERVEVYGFWPHDTDASGRRVAYHYDEDAAINRSRAAHKSHSWLTEWRVLTEIAAGVSVRTAPCVQG